MATSKTITLITIIVLAFTGCKNNSEKTENIEQSSKEAPTSQENDAKSDFTGNYVSGDYAKRSEGYDWVSVAVTEAGENQLHLAVRSRADKKKPTCTFDAIIQKVDDATYQTKINDKNVRFSFAADKITINTENTDDSGMLSFYCSGGASIAGEYQKINEPIDQIQIDKTTFSKILQSQGAGFNITAKPSDNGQQELTILPFGLSEDNTALTQRFEGSIVDAEIGDLNADESPEVVVYTQNDQNKSGNVIAVSVNNKKSMSLVSFQPTTENAKINKGYNGYDEFSLVENTLRQRFPIFADGKETGKIRQVDYNLIEGEASRRFVVKNTTELDKK